MDEEVKVAVQEILKCLQIKDLKTEQAKILKALLERRDCVAILPTGYGKSLPYQIAISVKRSLLRDEGEKNYRLLSAGCFNERSGHTAFHYSRH